LLAGLATQAGGTVAQINTAHAASARQIGRDADQAGAVCHAAELGKRAKAILMFPEYFEADLIIGGQRGDGLLRVGGETAGYCNIAIAS
jgi:lipid-binding SYLF domain-containing protein